MTITVSPPPPVDWLSNQNMLRLALAGSFIVTGCAALLAEQSFEKLLSRLVGASTPAAAIVLAVYFLGLTLGNGWYGRRFAGHAQPLRLFGWLEAGVALWSVLLITLSSSAVSFFTPLLRLGADHFALLQFLRFIVAVLWILPPTILMGATFPAIVDGLRDLSGAQPRRMMVRFYALNLLGAIVGALLGPYFAYPRLGLNGTLLFTAAIDGAVALFVIRVLAPQAQTQVVPIPEAVAAVPDAGAASALKLLAAISLTSGFLFFGLEILWTHLIGAVLGNSVYAFAAMLTLVLAGLGIGGALAAGLFPEDQPASAATVGVLLLAGSAALALQYGTWPQVPGSFIIWGQGITQFAQGEMLRWLQAGRLLLPATIVLGMVFPALFRLKLFPTTQRARAAAILGGWNAVGCVLGALLTGFVLIPALGSETTLMLFGFATQLCGLMLVLLYGRGRLKIPLVALAALCAIFWSAQKPWNRLALTSGGHVYFHPAFVGPDSKLLFFHEDTLGGITTVVGNPVAPATPENPHPPEMRVLLTNGKFQANDAGEVPAQTGLAMVPILHTRNFDDALVIGLGSGHSAETVRRMGFKRVDIAEISPGIVAAADLEFAHINGGVLHDPGVKLHLEDGRNFLLLTERKYDLITMEISSVWFAGSTSLYCREFYELTRAHLKPGGIMQQWIQIHHITMDEVGAVIATMRQVYPFVSFWLVGGQGILVAGDSPLKLQPSTFAATHARNPWGDHEQAVTDRRLQELAASRLLAPEEVDAMLKQVRFRINTDSNRFLEYATPRYNLSPLPYQVINLRSMALFAKFPPQEFSLPPPEPLRELIAAVTPTFQRQVLRLPEPPTLPPH